LFSTGAGALSAPIEHHYFINRGHPHTPDWLKMKNPACAVVKREAEED
jgi:hypothetical protein